MRAPEPASGDATALDPDPRLAEVMARVIELDAQLAAAQRSVADLTAALETNREIGAAIGIVMARRELDSDGAFELLRQVSQARHTKLREVARDVVAERRLVVPPAITSNGRMRAVPVPPPAFPERRGA